MKRLFFVLLAFSSICAKAQTAVLNPEEIVAKYSAAMGGLDKFKAITSAKMTGNVSVQGMDLPLTMMVVVGKSFRAEIEAMGKTLVQVYNNGKGWKIDPFNGSGDKTEVEGAELAGFKQQTMLANGLMNFKDLGNKIEYAGEETAEGVKCFKIKLTSAEDNSVTTYFISSNDYTLVKSSSPREVNGASIEIETLYSDLAEFNGVKIYKTRTQQADGQVFQVISLSTIELNVPIDPKSFD